MGRSFWQHYLLGLIFLFPKLSSGSAKGHFVDARGVVMTELDPAWGKLSDFYGRGGVTTISVIRKVFPFGNSRFNCDTNTIFINADVSDQNEVLQLAAHEGSHISLCIMTQQFNIQGESRFWDEGLATIIEYQAGGLEEKYKAQALTLAVTQTFKDNLSLAKVQNWTSYSRNISGAINSYAYGVGSTFDYFVIDTYGAAKLREFFRDIGSSRNFAKSVSNIFNKSSNEIEMDWKLYVLKSQISHSD